MIFTSCDSEESLSSEDSKNIVFVADDSIPQTKAAMASSITSYGVSCSAYASSGSYSSASFGNFFRALSCSNNTNTGFLWPGSSKKLSFYAYYPYGNSYLTLTSTTSNTGVPTYSYTTPTDISKQVDFCAAQVTDIAGNYNSKVTLPFKHVCSALSFKVKNTGSQAFTLKSVSFYGVKLSGTYSNGNWSTLGNASTASSNAMTITSNTSIAAGNTLDVSGTSNNIIVIPQTIAADTEIFDVLISYNGEDKHYYYKLSDKLSMQKGTQYSYTISINCYDPYNGYEYVDLGLPSGNLWATCNVGATSPEKAGLYFAWGETVGYTAEQVTAGERVFNNATYQAGPAASISDHLTLEQDAAHVNLGGNWRMPSNVEFEELINSSYTTQTWTDDYNGTGVAGRIFTSKTNGNSVFFPASGHCANSKVYVVGSYGYYWSSSMYSGFRYYLRSNSGEVVVGNDVYGYNGRPVRGVISGPYNGHKYVDLGLPSGLKWATCNVGATLPEQAGLYFAWGETVGYTAEQVTAGVRKFDKDTYNAGSAASISTNLTLEQDAAHVNMGGKWRMPTKAECQELIDNCDVTWTANYNGTGVAGRVFTSKTNGNSVFFPAAGYWGNSSVGSVGSQGLYWSASWYYVSVSAWYLWFTSGNMGVGSNGRYCGQPVRAVCE